jgi:hypothetical protein
VLELDPARHDVYQNLVQLYLIAGGGTPGFVPGYRAEAASYAELVRTAPARTFVPLLGDSLTLVPAESLSAYPPDSVAAARRRAVAAARLWVARWLEAGPGEAEAHLWASRAHDLADDLEAALRELNIADSLGVETGLENVPARRMALLARLGRYADGARIADSLWSARAFDVTTFTGYQIEGLGWAYTLFVLNGQHDRAAGLLERMTQMLAPAALARPELGAEALAVAFLSGYVRQFFALARDVRVTVLERLLDDAGRLEPGGLPVRLLPLQLDLLLRDTLAPDVRRRLGERVVRAASTLASTERADLAYELANEVSEDTALARTVEALDWFVRRRAAARAERVDSQRRFHAVSAAVTDTVATFTWTAEGDAFAWHRVETAIGQSDYHFTAEFEVAGTQYEVLAHIDRAPGTRPRRGDLAAMLGALRRQLHVMFPDTTVAHRPVVEAVVRAEPVPGGFQLVLRHGEVVAALRRERPAAVRMRFRPCERNPAVPCVDQQVRVEYP